VSEKLSVGEQIEEQNGAKWPFGAQIGCKN